MPPLNVATPIPFHRDADAAMPNGPTKSEKIADAAQKFEAILLGELLKTMRESAKVFSDESNAAPGSDLMGEFMDEHLARLLARGGGIGLGSMIASQLDRHSGGGQDLLPTHTARPASLLPGTGDNRIQRQRGPAVDGNRRFDSIVHRAARRYDLDPELIHAVIDQESGGKSGAVSPRGAKGLMQLMDGTAKEMGVRNPFDPQENIFGGARYLRKQLDRWQGDLGKALASYNAGPAAVDRYGGVPPFAETVNYVRRITSRLSGMNRNGQ